MKGAFPGWSVDTLFTAGYNVGGYSPPGMPDGLALYRKGSGIFRILVNHELNDDAGSVYSLANGTSLTGGRISYLDFDSATHQVITAGLAYNTMYDRAGLEVVNSNQISEGAGSMRGVNRFCSGVFFPAGQYGLEDSIYFASEEEANGQLFALDVAADELHSVPWAGRAAFENVTMVDPGIHFPDRVAMLLCDDTPGSPLYLYVGVKNYFGNSSFLDRNGLDHGELYVLCADGYYSPQQFNGTGSMLHGEFKRIEIYRPDSASSSHYDEQGFARQEEQQRLAAGLRALKFSRPEDIHVSPFDPTRAVFSSTGRGALFPQDDWGMVYIIDLDFRKYSTILADLRILYDSNDGGNQFGFPDFGLRNPDNVCWATDNKIYVQEDRALQLNGFGWTSGMDASVWQLDPLNGNALRVCLVNRQALLPEGQYDFSATDLGAWETSGITDAGLFGTDEPGGITLIADVMAHSVTGGTLVADSLVQGGQIVLIHGTNNGLEKSGINLRQLLVVPNPANAHSWLCFGESFNGAATIELFSIDGSRVYESTTVLPLPGFVLSLDLSSLSPGVYLARVRTSELSLTTRFVLH